MIHWNGINAEDMIFPLIVPQWENLNIVFAQCIESIRALNHIIIMTVMQNTGWVTFYFFTSPNPIISLRITKVKFHYTWQDGSVLGAYLPSVCIHGKTKDTLSSTQCLQSRAGISDNRGEVNEVRQGIEGGAGVEVGCKASCRGSRKCRQVKAA